MAEMDMVNHGDIGAAVRRLHRELPGWWWSIGWCHVSSDCTIGVDYKGTDAFLVYAADTRFDQGFDNDINGDDVASALHGAIDEALSVKNLLSEEDIRTARGLYERRPVVPFMRGHGAALSPVPSTEEA